MEAPLVKGGPLAWTWAWTEATGEQQKVACTVVKVDCSELALPEVWTTTSWLSGYLRACNVSPDP